MDWKTYEKRRPHGAWFLVKGRGYGTGVFFGRDAKSFFCVCCMQKNTCLVLCPEPPYWNSLPNSGIWSPGPLGPLVRSQKVHSSIRCVHPRSLGSGLQSLVTRSGSMVVLLCPSSLLPRPPDGQCMLRAKSIAGMDVFQP